MSTWHNAMAEKIALSQEPVATGLIGSGGFVVWHF